MKQGKRQLKLIVERDEDGFFVADVPALQGCHAQGRTMEELRKNTLEVIALCLEEARVNKAYQKRIREFSYEPSFIGIDTVTL